MALSGTLPILWGLATGRLSDAVWITVTAEAISWVELKGSFTWRVRTLISAALLAVACAILGTITAPYIWLSVVAMFAVGFIATLLKNIGDRASGLAISVYLSYIICNAFKVHGAEELKHRIILVSIGAAWPVVVGMAISLVTPAEEPFRRQIALIWRAIAALVNTVSKSDNRAGFTKMLADVYAKEKEVRKAIDNSYDFYGRMAHQANKNDNQQYQLVLLRKAASLVAVNVIAMGDEMEQIAVHQLNKPLRIKAATLFSALEEAVSRISIYVITLKPEERLLAVSHINRMKKLIVLIKETTLPTDEQQARAITRILHLAGRTIKLMERSLQHVEQMGQDVPVFRSYSLLKTSFVLKPKYLLRNIQILFNFNTFNTRYALRSAIAVTFALFIYKWFDIDHGYWLPFSVMIVIQAYFGATFQKAVDRIAGTVLGGLAGGLLLHLPKGWHINEFILFLTFVLMVYYARRRYSVATFVITLNLVLLFNFESSYSNMLMVTRALCTIGGSILAVVAGFALLPTWDKKWLPSHLSSAIRSNYEYFIATFYTAAPLTTWTKFKRTAESDNSNVFDSFNRYMEEPGKEKSSLYYDLISHNVRITRNLNNIHLDQDEQNNNRRVAADEIQQQRIDECKEWFARVVSYLPELNTKLAPLSVPATTNTSFQLTTAQVISLEKLIIELTAMHQDMEKLLHGFQV